MDSLADSRAEQLLRLGLDLAVRLRDEDPAAARRALDGLDRTDLLDLATLLAACVPVQVPRSALLGWYTHPRHEHRPCGTPAAARRHHERGEALDPLCDIAGKEHDRIRKRTSRTAADTQARPHTVDSASTQEA